MFQLQMCRNSSVKTKGYRRAEEKNWNSVFVLQLFMARCEWVHYGTTFVPAQMSQSYQFESVNMIVKCLGYPTTNRLKQYYGNVWNIRNEKWLVHDVVCVPPHVNCEQSIDYTYTSLAYWDRVEVLSSCIRRMHGPTLKDENRIRIEKSIHKSN